MSVVLSTQGADRAWQRQLDMCLTLLEDAHERDVQIVSSAVSAKVRPFVPGIVTGMPIAQALDLVFRAQDDCLQCVTRGSERSAGAPADEIDISSLMEPETSSRGDAESIAEPLDARAARALTEKIKSAANNFSLLLLEAQERQAWVALGYRTWERYVRQEFGLSRTRSYELLDHGRLIRAIQATTGVSLIADIPPYAARKVKPYFGQFIAGLKSRVEGRPAEEIPLIVSDVIRNARPRVRVLERREPVTQLSDRAIDAIAVSSLGRRTLTVDVEVVWAVIEYLVSLPPAADVASQLEDAASVLSTLERATAWLSDLEAELRAQHPAIAESHAPAPRRMATG
jgi:hypothetical protein